MIVSSEPESNVASSADNYQRYEEYFATSRITNRTDVDRMRQNWLNSQKNLIELKDSYRDSVESYLMALGLPPDVENVVVRDPLLDQFVLMPTTLENFQNDVATLLGWLRNKNNEVVGSSDRRYVNSIDDLKGKEGQVTRVSVADLRAIFGDFDAQFAAGLRETNDDVENLENNVRPRRQAALDTIRARFETENPELDSSFADYKLFDERVATIREDLDRPKEELSDSGVVLKARGAKYNLAKIFELINQTVLAYSPDELAEMILLRREDPSSSPFPSTVMQLVSDVHMESELNDPNQFNADEIEAELARLEVMARTLTDENRAEYIARKSALEKALSNLRSGSLMRADVYRIWFSSCLTKLSEELMTLRLIQARARLESIELATVDVNSEEAFQVARERRLDWMNMRSNLVDQWRNIEIVADQLRSDLSVQVGAALFEVPSEQPAVGQLSGLFVKIPLDLEGTFISVKMVLNPQRSSVRKDLALQRAVPDKGSGVRRVIPEIQIHGKVHGLRLQPHGICLQGIRSAHQKPPPVDCCIFVDKNDYLVLLQVLHRKPGFVGRAECTIILGVIILNRDIAGLFDFSDEDIHHVFFRFDIQDTVFQSHLADTRQLRKDSLRQPVLSFGAEHSQRLRERILFHKGDRRLGSLRDGGEGVHRIQDFRFTL